MCEVVARFRERNTEMNTTHQAEETTRVHAHYANIKKLGHWTTARRFEVRAQRGYVVLDLRSPQIPGGDVEIKLDLDHSMVKLLAPEDAVIDHWDLTMVGRGRVKDNQGGQAPDGQAAGGRRIRITGQVRHGEIRVNRGGVAVLSAMFSREYVADVRRANREGSMPTVDDPARTA
jgi:hypothetical protein